MTQNQRRTGIDNQRQVVREKETDKEIHGKKEEGESRKTRKRDGKTETHRGTDVEKVRETEAGRERTVRRGKGWDEGLEREKTDSKSVCVSETFKSKSMSKSQVTSV